MGDEDWAPIREFDGYLVSSRGQVMNEHTGRVLRLTCNTGGVLMAGMMRNGIQHKRGVDLLVAEAFLEKPVEPSFASVIHLDGVFENCDCDNLMWRPRWFRIQYHKQMRTAPLIRGPVYLIDLDQHFENSQHAAMTHGLLEKHILLSLTNPGGVWPYGYDFRVRQL